MADEPGVVERNRPFAEDLANRLIQAKAERDEALRRLAEMELGTGELLTAAAAQMYQQAQEIAALRDALVEVSHCGSLHAQQIALAALREFDRKGKE